MYPSIVSSQILDRSAGVAVTASPVEHEDFMVAVGECDLRGRDAGTNGGRIVGRILRWIGHEQDAHRWLRTRAAGEEERPPGLLLGNDLEAVFALDALAVNDFHVAKVVQELLDVLRHVVVLVARVCSRSTDVGVEVAQWQEQAQMSAWSQDAGPFGQRLVRMPEIFEAVA